MRLKTPPGEDVGIFGRKKFDPNDSSLNDAEWLRSGESRYAAAIGRYYGSPETIARGGLERRDDPAAALFFFQKSIDLLHTQYGFLGMKTRRPGPADDAITEAYLNTLTRVREMRPDAAVADSVREVTHRLRAISSECKSRGLDPGPYLAVLGRLGDLTPDINVDDIFWT